MYIEAKRFFLFNKAHMISDGFLGENRAHWAHPPPRVLQGANHKVAR